MADISHEDRMQLRRTLKWSLRAEPWRSTESNGMTKAWYDKKLDGLMGYGLAKERMSGRVRKIMRLHFNQGIPADKIAFDLHLSTRQVFRDLNQGLDLIIDNIPQEMIVSLSPASYQWLLQGCPHCRGDMYWDSEGSRGLDGEYCCISCGKRHTIQEMEDYQTVKIEAKMSVCHEGIDKSGTNDVIIDYKR